MLETTLKPDDTAERCGLVLKDGTLVELSNVAPDPAIAFEMSAEELLPYVIDGSIATMWHTHPDSDPTLSGADHDGFVGWPDVVHAIVGRRDGEVLVLRYRIEDGLVIVCD